MLNIILADILHYLHIIIILLLFFPFVLPPGEWLKYVVIITALIITGWHDGIAECDLTALEKRLRGTWRKKTSNDPAPFFQPLLNKVLAPFNKHISAENAEHFNYLLFLVILLVSFINYCSFKNISFKPKTALSKKYVGIIYLILIGFFTNIVIRHIML